MRRGRVRGAPLRRADGGSLTTPFSSSIYRVFPQGGVVVPPKSRLRARIPWRATHDPEDRLSGR